MHVVARVCLLVGSSASRRSMPKMRTGYAISKEEELPFHETAEVGNQMKQMEAGVDVQTSAVKFHRRRLVGEYGTDGKTGGEEFLRLDLR